MKMHSSHGFTLIEIAVAVFIIALVMGSILVPLTTQVESRQVSDTQKNLDEIRDALIGFAVANGYLPCPDTDTDGSENLTGSNCTSAEGNFPHSTLGVNGVDVWGNRLRYRVDTDFTNRATLFTLQSEANLEVCTTSTCSTALPEQVLITPGATFPRNGAVAVVLSHGKNGSGATNPLGVTNSAPPSANELENTDNDSRFVSRPHGSGTFGEFDDVVTWVGKSLLFNRMVAAGKLP
jgi:prepilin-type N-terminal cleavage/methylation domain-containing protein